MSTRKTCPQCQAVIDVSEDGAAIVCPGCGNRFKRRLRPSALPTTSPERFGRFEIRRPLGCGAFGTVYLAHDPQLDREVALKVPHPGTLADPHRVERFLREARAAAHLHHPNIVPLYEAGQHDGTYYIATAFVAGQELSDAIPDHGMDFRQAADIVRRLADALTYAHEQGIVHRDVKPQNVLLDDKGQPHLMDFGLAARLDESEKLTQDGTILGTPAYLAPEQAAGKQGDPQPASDQYSLGVLLFELLTGRTPFEGTSAAVLAQVLAAKMPAPRTLRSRIPRDLETICLKCLSKKPGDRYASCALLASDLRLWLENQPIRARRLTFLEQLLRWASQSLLVLSLVGTAVLIGAVCLSLATYLGTEASAEAKRAEIAAERTRKAEVLEKEEAGQADLAAARADKEAARADREEARARVAEERTKKADEERAKLEAMP